MGVRMIPAARSERISTDGVRRERMHAAVPVRAGLRDASRLDFPTTSRDGAVRRKRIVAYQEINEEASGMQQTMEYLGTFGDSLQTLKQMVGARVMGNASEVEVRSQIEHTAGVWHRRRHETGARLDDMLRLGDIGSAKRLFAVQGLRARDSRRAEGEVVTFHLGGTGAGPATIYFAPYISDHEMIYQLKSGLAPLGIGCGPDAQGRLYFSVDEVRWPLIARGLHVRGGGVRLPDGGAQRAVLADHPERIDPDGWQMHDGEASRATLRNVVQTQKRVEQAFNRAQETLGRTRRKLDELATTASETLANTVSWREAVERTDSAGGHDYVATLAVAALGLDRVRVRELLTLRK